ncbi:MAG: cyclic pyranopterin monophosphate synthase MoaC [Gammaproteobacteria bacterium]|nr:cyclic pyranopterin monophosphate synthase MoaC [Gammaproteobacteria bacterium]
MPAPRGADYNPAMLSHIDDANQPTMVDVSGKAVTARSAHAQAKVLLPDVVRQGLDAGELHSPKGPVFQTAIIAGTMAAKKTAELIPFCHPLGLDGCRITIAMDAQGHAVIDCVVRVEHRTGVEMEALTGATVAALTVYDMCKALSHDMVITEVRLIAKTGGKSDIGAPPAPHA